MLRLFALLILALPLTCADAGSLDLQAKIYSPLRDAPPWNGNPAYPAASYFGSALSVSGATAAIMEREPFGETFLRLYERDANGHWSTAQSILPPADLSPFLKAGFGGRHALDGDRLAVALSHPSSPSPQVIVFEKIAGTWQESARIAGQPYAAFNGSFGEGGVALSGDTLAVGSPGNSPGAFGAVHVFTLQGGSWVLQQRVQETDPYPAANFGYNLRLQGDRLVVNRPGARYEEYASHGVYVFDRSNGAWSQQAKITQPPPPTPGAYIIGYFGISLALDGARLVILDQEMRDIGGSGAPFDVARVYERAPGGQWPLTASLDTGAIHQGNPAPTVSVALRDTRLLVGQVYLQNDLYAGTVPKVFLFEHDGAAWSGARTLSPYDWELGWVDGADVKVRYGVGFGDHVNQMGGIAFDDRGAALIAASNDGLVVPLQMNSNPPGTVYVLTDSDGLFCDGFQSNGPRCDGAPLAQPPQH